MSFPYMPFYAGDYFKKTRGLRTAELHGAYLLLIIELWNHDGELPLDEETLAAIAHVSPRRWPYVWSKIGPHFLTGAGVIRHPRVDEEIAKAHALSKSRQNSGRKGGFAKSLKDKGAELARPWQGHSNQNHTHNHIKRGAPLRVVDSRRSGAVNAPAPTTREPSEKSTADIIADLDAFADRLSQKSKPQKEG